MSSQSVMSSQHETGRVSKTSRHNESTGALPVKAESGYSVEQQGLLV